MSNSISERNNAAHSNSEFGNLWASQKLIRAWANNPELSSYDVIPQLYTALHRGEVITHDGDQELFLHHFLRKGRVRLSGNPSDLLPEGRFVYPLIARYCDDLDGILRSKPKTTQKAIEDAAFAYYVFERIHPFPDGNGRIGRMITKTVLKSSGLRDPLFHDRRWYEGARSDQLVALERVSETNNLAHLELYLSEVLYETYSKGNDFRRIDELNRIIKIKEKESKQNIFNGSVSDIWEGFRDIPMHGNMV